jgi:hypothetical protein
MKDFKFNKTEPGKPIMSLLNLPNLALGVLFVCLCLLALSSKGTSDVTQAFVPWIQSAVENGFIANYQSQVTAYPPGYILIPYLLTAHFGLQAFWAYKLFMLLSVVFTIYAGNRLLNLRSGTIVAILFVYPSLVLGYGDSLIVALLLLTLANLRENKFFKVGILLGIVLSIKFTPLLIIPMILVYVFRWENPAFPKKLRQTKIGKVVTVGIGFACWTIPLTSITGITMFIENLKLALLNGYLSGNALNLGWIITKIQMGPGSVPSYTEDERLIRFIYLDVHSELYRSMKFFALIAIALIVIYSFRFEKSIENTALVSVLTLFAYYQFAPGVHENHLTLAIPFAVILFQSQEIRLRILGSVISLISLVNLFSFYTFSGNYNTSRIFFDLDITLILAIFEFVGGLLLMILFILNKFNLRPR